MELPVLSKTYDGKTVLNLPPLSLEPGKIYAVIGANGSGKSTFAKIIAGVITADNKVKPVDPKLQIGYMPQKNFAFRMSVRANLHLTGTDSADVEALMKKLQISHLASRKANCLSGGEIARVALARVLSRKCDLVILDEPTADMDMEAASLTEKLITEYCRCSGCILLLITHSLQQARRIADEVLFFRNGIVLETGPASQVLYEPKNPDTRTFLEFYGDLT